jgi:hypothetical protein
MAISIVEAVQRIKADVAYFLSPTSIRAVCRNLGHTWRERVLDPVTTLHVFLLQVLHGNTACSALPHLSELGFSAAAYGKARRRLPVTLFAVLLRQVCTHLQATLGAEGRWRGHRTWLVDGSSFSTPDVPQLQQHFGQPTHQKPGCGFPVAHMLALFHAGTGFLLRVLAAPLHTSDAVQAPAIHEALAAGDVLVGDRMFASFVHLALLQQRKIQGVFRMHQKQIVNFRPHRRFSHGSRKQKGQPSSRWLRRLGHWDQVVEYFKPSQRPAWMSAEQFAALPESIRVRELRYRVRQRGVRTRLVTLVTTLLNPLRYPAAELAKLYCSRWQVELNLRHLKQTMRMDHLHCKTVDGVTKELYMFALAYNLVRLVMLAAARRQGALVERISFVDALRWLREAQPGTPLRELILNPHRPGRIEPRVLKRRLKKFPLMKRAREELRKAMRRKSVAA